MLIKILLVLCIMCLILTLINFTTASLDGSCIEPSTSSTDVDGDGILNIFEEKGIDINNDNIIDLDLSNISDPLHKDIFLELDYMQNHMPNQTGMNNVIRVFENAPVRNPSGSQGINLHIAIDDLIPHDNITLIECSESQNRLSSPVSETKGDNLD